MIVRKDKNHSSILNSSGDKSLSSPVDKGSDSLSDNTAPSTINTVQREIQSIGPKTSLYAQSNVRNLTNTEVSLYEILQDIKQGTGAAPKAKTSHVRSFIGKVSKKEYSKIKAKHLQAIIPACVLRDTHALTDPTNLLQHNPAINIDIDVKDNPELFADPERLNQFLATLKADKHVIAYWFSISYGISILYKLHSDQVFGAESIDELKQYHLNAFLNFQKQFAAQGIEIDAACKNVNRVRFINYDPSIYINPLFEQGRYDAIEGYVPGEDLVTKKVVDRVSGSGSTIVSSANEIVNHVLTIAQNKGKSFSDGHRADFIAFVGGMLNRFGVSQEEAVNALGIAIDLSSYDEHLQRLQDVYERYSHQHATEVFTKLQPKQKRKKLTIAEHINGYAPQAKARPCDVVVNRYLTEFDLPTDGDFILNVPTNAGKTFYFANSATGKRILLVPTKALAEQIQADYGIKAVYEGVTVSKSDLIVVATYDALTKLMQGLNVSNYELWVDEAHSFVQATSKSYRNKALSNVAEFMPMFKRVVLLSGTWIATTVPMFDGFEYLKIRSETKELGQFNYVVADNKKELLKQHISSNRTVKHAIYYNDKSDGEALAEALKIGGLGTYLLLNSDNQKEHVQAEFIRTGLLPDIYAGVIFTDIIKEGLGIKNKMVSIDTHLLTKADSVTTEQVINRPRNVVARTYYYVSTTDAVATNYHSEADRLQREQELRGKAQERVDYLETIRVASLNSGYRSDYGTFVKATERTKATRNGAYWPQLINVSSDVEKQNEINELGIANAAYEWYAKAERANPKMFLDNMASLGYTVNIVFASAQKTTFSSDLKAAADFIKASRADYVKATIETFVEQGAAYVAEVHESPKSTTVEKDLAFKYGYLDSRMANAEDVAAVMQERDISKPEVWNRLKKRVTNEIYIRTMLHLNYRSNASTRGYVNAFEVGRTYDSTEIFDISKRVMAKYADSKDSAAELTPVTALQYLKLHFVLKADTNKKRTFKIERLGAFDYELRPEFSTPYQPRKQDTLLRDNVIDNPTFSNEQSVLEASIHSTGNQSLTVKSEGQTCSNALGAEAGHEPAPNHAPEASQSELHRAIQAMDFS